MALPVKNRIRWFQFLLALHQIIYLISFWPQVSSWFTSGEMVIANRVFPYSPSLLHLFDSPSAAQVIWVIALLGWIFFAFGKLSKLAQIFLFVIQVSLHNANPLIIHEPQQLANFFLFVSILWPADRETAAIQSMARLMLAFLCCYYFFAGIKKLPDPNWINGEALSILLKWPPLAKDNFITRQILDNSILAHLLTWATLFFELGFSLVAWSRWRIHLIPLGIVFHFFIAATLEVGTFGWIMAPWYVFLINFESWSRSTSEPTIKKNS